MSFLDRFASRLGYSKSNEDLIFNAIPKEKRELILRKMEELYDTDLYKDPLEVSKRISSLDNEFDRHLDHKIEQIKGFPLTSTSNAQLGYEAAGSTLRKLYPNPFAPYSFVGNNHWAVFRARAAFREDCARDGFVFVAPEGTSKKKLKYIQAVFDDLNLEEKMLDMMDHLNVFGNCWIDRDKGFLGGLKGLQLLLPERVVPVMDNFGDFVTGWQYYIHGQELFIPLGKVDHLKTYNLRSMQLGSPALASVLTDIEADMYASIYANMIFQKGGLIRAIVSLGNVKDVAEDVANLNPNTALDFALKVWELFTRQQSGLRGAAALTFLPNVQNVYPITNPKDMEGPYRETSDRTASKACNILGISPGRLNVHTFSQYENKISVEDYNAIDSDNHRIFLAAIVFNYVNKVIIKEYAGVSDVEIGFSGEYCSTSKNAAEFAQYLANAGARTITSNEFRTRCLHWEADPDLEGEYIGDGKNELLKAQAEAAVMEPDPVKKELLLEKIFGKKIPILGSSFYGKRLIKYKPRDIRLLS